MNYFIDTCDRRNEIVLSKLRELGNNCFVYLQYINNIKSGDVVVFSPNRKIIDEDILFFPQKIHLFCGNICEDVLNKLKEKNIIIHNYMVDENFSSFNAELTAQGILSIIISNTNNSLFENKYLILGSGRISKATNFLLKKIGLYVGICSFNKTEYHNSFYFCNKNYFEYEFVNDIEKYSVIINTRPFNYIDKKIIDKIKKNTLFLETASVNCLDSKLVSDFTYLNCPALPQKYCVESASNIIVEKIIREI